MQGRLQSAWHPRTTGMPLGNPSSLDEEVRGQEHAFPFAQEPHSRSLPGSGRCNPAGAGVLPVSPSSQGETWMTAPLSMRERSPTMALVMVHSSR